MKRKLKKWPKISDPRWLQLAVLCAYSIVAREIYHVERSHWVTLACVVLAVTLDMVIGYLKYRIIRFPLSSIISALACSLLLDSRTVFPYLLAVSLSILSKTIINYDGRHIFNPANFGVVAVLQLLPHQASGMPSLFGGAASPAVVFGIVGCIVAAYAGQWITSIAWVVGFILLGLLRSSLAHSLVTVTLAPVLAPTFILFSFHMINDPATTPASKRGKVGFALLVAILDAVFRFLQVPFGNFYALFWVSGLMPWVIDHEKGRSKRR